MKLNLHTEYAFRVVVYLLAYPDRIVPTREIAEKFHISVNHLNKVSQSLAALDLIVSTRGKGGGITLKQEAKSLKVGDLLKTMEPQGELARCSGGGGLEPCLISSLCRLRGVLAQAQNGFWQYLNQYTVGDLVGAEAEQLRELFEKQ